MKPAGQPEHGEYGEQPTSRVLLMLARNFLCNEKYTRALIGFCLLMKSSLGLIRAPWSLITYPSFYSSKITFTNAHCDCLMPGSEISHCYPVQVLQYFGQLKINVCVCSLTIRLCRHTLTEQLLSSCSTLRIQDIACIGNRNCRVKRTVSDITIFHSLSSHYSTDF